MILDQAAFSPLLSKGENIHYVAHVHIFTIFGDLFKTLLFGIGIPIGFYYLLPTAPFYWIWLAWIGMGIVVIAYRLIQWYLDAWIITNTSVIDQEWVSPFEKSSTRLDYGNIESISTQIKGFWGTVLQYGTIQIEHMSGSTIYLRDVSKPKRVENLIMRYQAEFQQRQNVSNRDKLRELLIDLVQNHPTN